VQNEFEQADFEWNAGARIKELEQELHGCKNELEDAQKYLSLKNLQLLVCPTLLYRCTSC